MTRLCLTLSADTLEENLQILGENKPDMAELRVDFLDPGCAGSIVEFSRDIRIPLILTCRKTADGGVWKGSDKEREEYLLSCLEGDFDFIDLEEDETSAALREKASERGCRIIRSFHDFEKVPENLEERLQVMEKQGDLVKAAVMPTGIADLYRLFRIGREWKKDNLILLGMGDYGVPSRILASRMNSFLTFCSPRGKSAAPGHMSPDVLRGIYRVDKLDGKTRLYGIIGNPVLHTRSPQIHNDGLAATGQNGIYVPFTVDDPEEFFKLARFLGIRGFSVTVPHKQSVLALLDRQDDAVRKIGACNTVVREGNSWCGYNTDATGFIIPLKRKKGNLKGLKAAVLGAGGASRSAVYALVREGCETVVYNRTGSKAAALAEEMGCLSGSLEDFCSLLPGSFDLIIQTTSSGMEGSSSDNPVPNYEFAGNELVYDIIYTPPVTPFMDKAEQAGCPVLGGWPMLVEQAREQFRLFTGKTLPPQNS